MVHYFSGKCAATSEYCTFLIVYNVLGSNLVSSVQIVMELPIEHGLLLDNLLDLAHAPFTHTSTFAKGWSVPRYLLRFKLNPEANRINKNDTGVVLWLHQPNRDAKKNHFLCAKNN